MRVIVYNIQFTEKENRLNGRRNQTERMFEPTSTSFTDLDNHANLEEIGLRIISSLSENPQYQIIIFEESFLVEMAIFRFLCY